MGRAASRPRSLLSSRSGRSRPPSVPVEKREQEACSPPTASSKTAGAASVAWSSLHLHAREVSSTQRPTIHHGRTGATHGFGSFGPNSADASNPSPGILVLTSGSAHRARSGSRTRRSRRRTGRVARRRREGTPLLPASGTAIGSGSARLWPGPFSIGPPCSSSAAMSREGPFPCMAQAYRTAPSMSLHPRRALRWCIVGMPKMRRERGVIPPRVVSWRR
jgi:hypothetical protein